VAAEHTKPPTSLYTHRLSLPQDDDFALAATVQFSLDSAPAVPGGRGGRVKGSASQPTFGGSLTSLRGEEPVTVSLVRLGGASLGLGPLEPQLQTQLQQLQVQRLETELRVLRRVTTANKHTARLLHGSVLPLSDALVQAQALPMPGTDSLGCVVWEHSAEGYLDAFLSRRKDGLKALDLQVMALQLIEAVMFVHSQGRAHRNLRPSSVLVTRASPFDPVAFADGLTLKLTDLCTAAPTETASATLATTVGAYDCWAPPEGREGSLSEQCRSDGYSLGCLLLYVASRGAQSSPFEDEAQLHTCLTEPVARVPLMTKVTEGLSASMAACGGGPMAHLFAQDMLERLVRAPSARQALPLVRCHPYLWGSETKMSVLRAVTTALAAPPQAQPPEAQAMRDELELYLPTYLLFAADGGWAAAMGGELLTRVRPSLAAQPHSGCALLLAVQGLLDAPESLAAVFPRLPAAAAEGKRQIQMACLGALDVAFPRLFWVVFEVLVRKNLLHFSMLGGGRVEVAGGRWSPVR